MSPLLVPVDDKGIVAGAIYLELLKQNFNWAVFIGGRSSLWYPATASLRALCLLRVFT